ncbi:hypothetical protein KL943_004967 [Ogataea angusta]|nr:hypothetical protein KL943_004967 [Ogataea angusta]
MGVPCTENARLQMNLSSSYEWTLNYRARTGMAFPHIPANLPSGNWVLGSALCGTPVSSRFNGERNLKGYLQPQSSESKYGVSMLIRSIDSMNGAGILVAGSLPTMSSLKYFEQLKIRGIP